MDNANGWCSPVPSGLPLLSVAPTPISPTTRSAPTFPGPPSARLGRASASSQKCRALHDRRRADTRHAQFGTRASAVGVNLRRWACDWIAHLRLMVCIRWDCRGLLSMFSPPAHRPLVSTDGEGHGIDGRPDVSQRRRLATPSPAAIDVSVGVSAGSRSFRPPPAAGRLADGLLSNPSVSAPTRVIDLAGGCAIISGRRLLQLFSASASRFLVSIAVGASPR